MDRGLSHADYELNWERCFMVTLHYLGPLLVGFYTVIGGASYGGCPSQVVVFVFTGATARTVLAGLLCLSALKRNWRRIPGTGQHKSTFAGTPHH
jgi:hypothetical protein